MLSLVYKNISDLIFNVDNRKQLSLMRIFLCGTLFYMACSRQLNMDQYGELSMIARGEALAIYPEFYRPAIQFFFWPDAWASQVHLVLIALLFLAMIGLSNRILMLITWVIAQGFINRNYSMLFGADLIGTLFLFYLAWTKCHDHYSVKTFFKKNVIQPAADIISAVFYRLMQLQLMVIYAYTGFEKLKGTTWWDGTALWTVFANPQFIGYDFIFLRTFPLFFAIGTFITLIFEIYFPAAMFLNKGRYAWLIMGVFFHLGIGILLSLMPFSMVMLSVYFLFINGKYIISFENFVIKQFNRFRLRQA